MTTPPVLPLRTRASIFLRLLAIQGSWNYETLLGNGESEPQALTGGYHVSFWIASALVVLAVLVAVTVLEPEDRAQEHAAADGGAGGAPVPDGGGERAAASEPEPAYSESR